MPATEAILLCLVVAISDGDTIKVRCDDQPQTVIHLAEIDAPEKGQAFGQRSKQHLSDVCFQKQAEVVPRTKDRYGRTVARVRCEGVDASAEQVRAGMAWAFIKYLTDPAIKQVESEARAAGTGLWVDHDPISPWDWRRSASTAHPACGQLRLPHATRGHTSCGAPSSTSVDTVSAGGEI